MANRTESKAPCIMKTAAAEMHVNCSLRLNLLFKIVRTAKQSVVGRQEGFKTYMTKKQ